VGGVIARVAAVGAIAATLAAVAIAAYAAPPAAGATPAPTITRSAHVTYANCSAQQILLTVTVPRHAFTPTQRVPVTVRLRNTGGTTCGAPLAKGVPEAHQTLTVGPCAALSMVVRSSRGVDLYPGPAVFHCPEETGFQLGPHSTAQTTAYWSQVAYLGPSSDLRTRQAPPGTYRVTVDQAVSVPVTLAPG
jgi:hypothetical protein